ncbi:hypothetical protein PROFUN_17118 [Planoprotostelium fungivorum]|uniref:Uncharacterized protein n=1 Tax=Planoprotostelium fungivorum TaxID=1890364 RepID=A0A2P6MMI9_9EUKA|nr:hypothetical protein PROFUN_17118 [Planoprotostelium fungivorum]
MTIPELSKVWITLMYAKKIAYIGTYLCYLVSLTSGCLLE